MNRESLEMAFPALRSTKYRISSPDDPRYNCIAWAAGESGAWWWPDAFGLYAWPPDVPREHALTAFVQAYAQLGYQQCPSSNPESGFDKVAIFSDSDGRPTHAARQLPSGKWTSKLGVSVDIEHSLDALQGERYGSVAFIMKRPLNKWTLG